MADEIRQETGGAFWQDGLHSDEEAMVAGWIARHREEMLGVATRMGLGLHAEDVVQTASLKAVEIARTDPGRVRAVEDPGKWLRGIVWNMARNHRKAQARRDRRAEAHSAQNGGGAVDVWCSADPADSYWDLADLEAIRVAATEVLTPRQQEIVGLALEGHGNPEIARKLRITRVTVRWQWREAVKKLQAWFAETDSSVREGDRS